MPGSASIELLQRADDQLRRIISRLSPAQAGLPTPCSEFNLRTLINHIVYDLQVFTAMISVGRGDLQTSIGLVTTAGGVQLVRRPAPVRVAKQGTGGTLTTRMGELPATLGTRTTHQRPGRARVGRRTSDREHRRARHRIGRGSSRLGRENLKPEFRGQAFGAEIPVPENPPDYDRLAAYFGRTPGQALEDSGTARRRLRCLESAVGRTRHSSQVTRTFHHASALRHWVSHAGERARRARRRHP